MTAIPVKRNLFDAILVEPIELAISQPHQALISGASVYLVASEAGMLIAPPFNWLMAVGAEWAYLKGLSSKRGVATPWAARLNWSAVILVVLYGSLWGFRKFGIPLPNEGFTATDAKSIIGAVALTLIHIICIGAVTLCSAMVHRAALEQEAREQDEAAERERERQAKIQAERDTMLLERERKEQDLILWQKAQEVKRHLRAAPAAKSSAERPPCPSCGVTLDGSDYALFKSAQARGARFNGCKTCRGA